MVYTCDSKSHAARLEGSSPSSSTIIRNTGFLPVFLMIVGNKGLEESEYIARSEASTI